MMGSKRRWIATTLLMGGLLAAAPSLPRAAETEHPAPPSALVEDARVLDGLDALARRPGQLGIEGQRLRDVLRAHISYREEVVLPSLTLLPRIAEGVVTPDMAWAVSAGERVHHDRNQHLLAHLDITDRLIAVFAAAQAADYEAAAQQAQDLAAFMLGDDEVDENVTVMVGNWLHRNLPAGG